VRVLGPLERQGTVFRSALESVGVPGKQRRLNARQPRRPRAPYLIGLIFEIWGHRSAFSLEEYSRSYRFQRKCLAGPRRASDHVRLSKVEGLADREESDRRMKVRLGTLSGLVPIDLAIAADQDGGRWRLKR
jgi:hypothetical protein